MMNTERNQPCPCGSGRKYKHCCSGTRTGASSPHTNGSARGAIRISPEVIAGYDWQADIERKGLISRVPRQARSIRVLVDRELLPELE